MARAAGAITDLTGLSRSVSLDAFGHQLRKASLRIFPDDS